MSFITEPLVLTRGERNNNPTHLAFLDPMHAQPWAGQTGRETFLKDEEHIRPTLATFATDVFGIRAAGRQLFRVQSYGDTRTIVRAIEKWEKTIPNPIDVALYIGWVGDELARLSSLYENWSAEKRATTLLDFSDETVLRALTHGVIMLKNKRNLYDARTMQTAVRQALGIEETPRL